MLIVLQQAVFAQLARHIAANRGGGGGAGAGGEGDEEGEGGDPVVITEENCSVM